MHWSVAAPFNRGENDWLCPFVPGDRHRFTLINRPGTDLNWHERKSAVSTRQDWMDFARQARAAARATDGGVITVFPQLAATVGLQQRLRRARRKRMPVVSWFFNTELTGGKKAAVAVHAMKDIDAFVVHTRKEREAYSEYLQLPIERFEFVPLQIGDVLPPGEVDEDEPFVFATGSGFRDYATMFAAVERLGYPTKIVSGPRALAGLDVPANVEILEGLNRNEIRRLMQRARVNVVPLGPGGVVAGFVTIVETIRHGRAMVITDRDGVDDYVQHGESSLFVPMANVDSMANAIDAMWSDPNLRGRLDAAAKSFADANCTDQAAGASLGAVLSRVADSHGRV